MKTFVIYIIFILASVDKRKDENDIKSSKNLMQSFSFKKNLINDNKDIKLKSPQSLVQNLDFSSPSVNKKFFESEDKKEDENNINITKNNGNIGYISNNKHNNLKFVNFYKLNNKTFGAKTKSTNLFSTKPKSLYLNQQSEKNNKSHRHNDESINRLTNNYTTKNKSSKNINFSINTNGYMNSNNIEENFLDRDYLDNSNNKNGKRPEDNQYSETKNIFINSIDQNDYNRDVINKHLNSLFNSFDNNSKNEILKTRLNQPSSYLDRAPLNNLTNKNAHSQKNKVVSIMSVKFNNPHNTYNSNLFSSKEKERIYNTNLNKRNEIYKNVVNSQSDISKDKRHVFKPLDHNLLGNKAQSNNNLERIANENLNEIYNKRNTPMARKAIDLNTFNNYNFNKKTKRNKSFSAIKYVTNQFKNKDNNNIFSEIILNTFGNEKDFINPLNSYNRVSTSHNKKNNLFNEKSKFKDIKVEELLTYNTKQNNKSAYSNVKSRYLNYEKKKHKTIEDYINNNSSPINKLNDPDIDSMSNITNGNNKVAVKSKASKKSFYSTNKSVNFYYNNWKNKNSNTTESNGVYSQREDQTKLAEYAAITKNEDENNLEISNTEVLNKFRNQNKLLDNFDMILKNFEFNKVQAQQNYYNMPYSHDDNLAKNLHFNQQNMKDINKVTQGNINFNEFIKNEFLDIPVLNKINHYKSHQKYNTASENSNNFEITQSNNNNVDTSNFGKNVEGNKFIKNKYKDLLEIYFSE